MPAGCRYKSRWPWAAGVSSSMAILVIALWWLLSPIPPPKITGTTQITHDGILKFALIDRW